MPKKQMRGALTKSKRKEKLSRQPRPASSAPAVAAPPRPASSFARPSAASAIQAAPRAAARASRGASAPLPTDYGYVATDLRRIGIMAASAVVVLAGLSFLLH